ncbi:MAG: helix-turn-helix transcriptional regulator [Salegentibacter mishustinae]|nr:helix-turn-helix transcriptional regulator [Salegentibacter mishustinae]
MKKQKTDKLNSLISENKSGWLEKAKWREENEGWLDISFGIAVKILSALRENKKTSTFPRTQKELAEAMDCSPQYVNKVLKGAENLQLETISKIGMILNIQLVEVPKSHKAEPAFNAGAWTELYGKNISTEKLVRKNKKALLSPKSPKKEKVALTGMAYSTLVDEFAFEEDFDNDPQSPLKLVA